jgi:5-methylthioadenosine/S-adenosylhomocysteine deaminase
MNHSRYQLNSRRAFIAQLAFAGLGAITGMPLVNAAGKMQHDNGPSALTLIKNVKVLTMDRSLGDFDSADILIENGRISAVRKSIYNTKAIIIDGTDMIALPGFVETHWHIWTSLMRGMASSAPGKDYFTMSTQLGKLYTPADTYHATRLGLAEAISSGITHVHDWSHNIISADHARASLKALQECGIRARFSVGVASGKNNIDLAILRDLKQNWKSYDNENLISLGLAWPGIEKDRPAGKLEIETARQLELPISVHVGRRKDGSDSVSKIAVDNLLGQDMQLVHGIDTTTAEYSQIAHAGASISASPFSELRIGYGLTPVNKMINSGAALGFSVDTTPLTGNADMFAIMKMFMNLANGMSRNEFKVSARRVLEIATVEGARSMGIEQLTGSITPGKLADIQLIRTNKINLGVLTDPYHTLITAAQPQNVDTVMINGKIVKRHGELTCLNSEEVITQANSSLTSLIARANT